LDEAVVFVGDSGTGVGRLAAGEERPWTVLGDAGGQTGDADFWPASSGQFGDVDHDSVVNFALWQVTGGQIGRARPDGVAMAVGWTREHRPTVLVDEAPRRPVGRTAVVARTAVEAPGPVTDMSVRGETVRGATFEAAQPTTVVRLSLPPGHQPTALLARLPAVGQAAEVWVDGRWRRLTTPAGEAAGQGSVSPPTTQPGVAVPGVAVPGGAAPAPVPVPPPPFGFRGKADLFGPTEVYAVPAGAVRNGLVFIRMPFTGMAPGQVTQLWEAA
ncbi:MAG TPA: hypothetical protein VFO65_06250, partial [Acidimicrobiales bacterium]|nr:hypothetical protein [Acidimicrobiales bacterium]